MHWPIPLAPSHGAITRAWHAGGTGYIGSLVVEQLLRTVPDVGQIYLLIRSKRGCSAQSRLDRLLSSGLFNMVRDDVSLCSKVTLLVTMLLILCLIPLSLAPRPEMDRKDTWCMTA